MLFRPRIKQVYYLSLFYNTEFNKTAPIVGELLHADRTHIPKTTEGTKYQSYVTIRTKNQDTTHTSWSRKKETSCKKL